MCIRCKVYHVGLELCHHITRYGRSVSSLGRVGLGSNYIRRDFTVAEEAYAFGLKFIMLD